MSPMTFKEVLQSLEITKIKSNAQADQVLEEAKKAGVVVPELGTHKEKLEFIKMMITGEVEVPEEKAPTVEAIVASQAAAGPLEANGAQIDVKPLTKSEQRRIDAQKEAPVVEEEAPKRYMGSIVVSESLQLLHGKTYKQIVCANGQTFLLTKEEYNLQVN